MTFPEDISKSEIARTLTYVGLVLVAYELVKGMIVQPIKFFYKNITFHEGFPFKSYEKDVRWRHQNEFEACLLYLRDFMEAIDSNDVLTIRAFRQHRNVLAHDLVERLPKLNIEEHQPLFDQLNRTLFKLSNYRAYMEIGADPEFSHVNWQTAKGHEYLLFEEIMKQAKLLTIPENC